MYRFWSTCKLILIGISYGTPWTNLRVFVDGNIGSDSLCGGSLVSLCEFAGSPLSSFFLSFLPTFFSIQVSRPPLPRPLNVFSGWPWPTWAILLLPPWSHQRTFKFTTLSNFSSANDKLQRKKIIFMLVLSFISQDIHWTQMSRYCKNGQKDLRAVLSLTAEFLFRKFLHLERGKKRKDSQ